jgi:hypothetical protein
MTVCVIHIDFFNETCMQCKKEYAELKGLNEPYLDKYDKSKLKKIGKKSIKNFLNNVLKGCMKICCCNSLRVITLKSKLQKKQDLLLESSAIYEVCHIGLGFDGTSFTLLLSLLLTNIFWLASQRWYNHDNVVSNRLS